MVCSLQLFAQSNLRHKSTQRLKAFVCVCACAHVRVLNMTQAAWAVSNDPIIWQHIHIHWTRTAAEVQSLWTWPTFKAGSRWRAKPYTMIFLLLLFWGGRFFPWLASCMCAFVRQPTGITLAVCTTIQTKRNEMNNEVTSQTHSVRGPFAILYSCTIGVHV